VIGILTEADWSGVLSVECGTPRQAATSLASLTAALAAAGK
jgi:hypothetical protein